MKASEILLVAVDDREAMAFKNMAPIVMVAPGKAAAAAHTAHKLSTMWVRPKILVSIGTAGAVSQAAKNASGAILPSVVKNWDFTADTLRELGISKATDVLETSEMVGRSNLVLGTGDRFVHEPEDVSALTSAGIDLVDMEAFAVGEVARKFGLGFVAIKAISDLTDETSVDEWQEALPLCSAHLAAALAAALD